MGGNFFGGSSGGFNNINVYATDDLLIRYNQKNFDYIVFDEGGSKKAAKIYYYTRIEKLKEKIKKNANITRELMIEVNDILKDLLSHRHVYETDLGYVSFGNRSISSDQTSTNKLSGYPAQIMNQVLVGEPAISGACMERWFSSCTDATNPEILESTAIMKYSRTVNSNYFNYSLYGGPNTKKIPTGLNSTNYNIGCIFDFYLNFTNSDLGLTKYFYITHDDSVIIYFNGQKVYDRDARTGHAFYKTIDASLINKPIKCQIIWCQGSGDYKMQLNWANTLGNTMFDYGPIPSSYISTLTPLTEERNDFTNTSFYLFIQYLGALFNHTHHYTDAGYSDYTYAQLKDFLETATLTATNVSVPISAQVGITNSTTKLINEQLPNGSGHYYEMKVDGSGNKRYVDIVISPFSVNL